MCMGYFLYIDAQTTPESSDRIAPEHATTDRAEGGDWMTSENMSTAKPGEIMDRI